MKKISFPSDTRIAVMLLIIMSVLMMTSALCKSATGDEWLYIASAGYLAHGSHWQIPVNLWHPPFVLYVQGLLSFFSFHNAYTRLMVGRLAMLPFSVLLGVYLFRWVKAVYSSRAAIFSLALFCFSPNILAHGRLVTLDVPMVTMSFITLYYLWRYGNERRIRFLLISSIMLGAALLTKFTCLILMPVYALILGGMLYARVRHKTSGRGLWARVVGIPAISMAGALVVLNLGYVCTESFYWWEGYSFISQAFGQLASTRLGNSLMWCFPGPYLKGLDYQRYISEFGFPGFFMGTYFLEGKWYYFPLLMAIKTPVALLIITACGVIAARIQARERSFLIVLLLPAAVILIYFCFLNHLTIGLRHILFIYPVAAGVSARLVTSARIKKYRWARWCVGLLLIWYITGSVLIYPDYLAYANECAGGPKNAYRLVHDSNLNWGQDTARAHFYWKDQPGPWACNPDEAVPGKILISTSNMQNYLLLGKDAPRWLWDAQPVDMIGYTWLIFDLPLTSFEQVFERGHATSYAYVTLADAYYNSQKYDKARDIIARGRARFPGNAPLVYRAARLALQAGERARAGSLLEQVIEYGADTREVYMTLGCLYEQNGDEQNAGRVQELWMRARTIKGYLKQPVLNSAYYHEHILADENNCELYNNLGVCHWMEGDRPAAIDAFKQAVTKEPRFADGYLNLARLYEECGEFNKALEAHACYLALWHSAERYEKPRLFRNDQPVMLHDVLVISQYPHTYPDNDETVYHKILEYKAFITAHGMDKEICIKMAQAYQRLGEDVLALHYFIKASDRAAGDADVQSSINAIYKKYTIPFT